MPECFLRTPFFIEHLWRLLLTEEIEKKRKKKIDISNSNHEIGFLNFLRFIALKVISATKLFFAIK